MDLEPASLERNEIVHLVEVVNPCAELLGQVEVVRRQLVLGVVTAADVAVAARDAAGAAGSDSAELRIVGFDTGAPEVDANRGSVERFPSPYFDGGLPQCPIDVGGHVGIANDAELRVAWSRHGASSSAQSVMPAHSGASKNCFGGTYSVFA